jgi:RNA polymerase sigma-70 factor (ECF subfamily)
LDWQSIISEHGPMVWKTAFRLLGNEADTSDCFQDIFLTAVQVARREKIRNLPALLNRLATHKAIDLLRRRMQTPKITPSMDCDDCPDMSFNPAQSAQDKELSDHLRQALITLPDLEAQAFCLQTFNDLSYRQIAAQLQVKTGYVGALISRAREKLQRLLSSATVNEEIRSKTYE